MRQLKILKTATVTANVHPNPGVIVLPAPVSDESLIQIWLAGGFSDDLKIQEIAGASEPYLTVHDVPAAHPGPHLIWEGRAKGAPLNLYATSSKSITYTIVLCAED